MLRKTSFIGAFLYFMLFIVLGQTAIEERRDARSPWDAGEWGIVTEDPGIPVLPMPTNIPVTVTIYHPVRGQTDSTPNIVASGKRISIRYASRHRYLAVSRDLHVRWGGPLSFGEIVYLKDAGELSGYYIVEDTMNARFRNRVDILRSPGAPLAKFPRATLVMVSCE